MAGRGPAPTPTELLKLRGSKRAKARAGEVVFAKGLAGPPSCLDAEAAAEWRRVTRELEAVGMAQRVDRALLTAYCEAWGEFVTFVKLSKESGHKQAVALGYVKAKNAAAERLRKMAEQFGFSPAARTRVKATEKGRVDDTLRYFDGTALG